MKKSRASSEDRPRVRAGRRGTATPAAPEPMRAAANISIVLVEPQSPGNVGSTARAMMNTGFSDLVLINPCEYFNDDAFSMACNAAAVLKNARVFQDLASYRGEPRLVVGTTRRIGRVRYPVMTLGEAAPVILSHAEKNRVAVLFGREDKGLTNDEIAVCDMLVEIPTHEDYPSMNLAHAVLTVCYRLFIVERPKAPAIVAADPGEVEGMYAHMEKALRSIGYGATNDGYLLKAIIRSFKRLFGRTALMQKEVNMLRGILTSIEEAAKDPGSASRETDGRKR